MGEPETPRSAESAGFTFPRSWFSAAKGLTPQRFKDIRVIWSTLALLVSTYWNVRPPRNGLPLSPVYTVVASVPEMSLLAKAPLVLAKTAAPLTGALPSTGEAGAPGGSGVAMMANTGADVAMVNSDTAIG